MAEGTPDEDAHEPRKATARTGRFWFTETEKCRNFRIGKLIVAVFSVYISITVLGIAAVLLAFLFPDEDYFFIFIAVFGVCLASYVPFVALYLRFGRVRRLDFYANGVMCESFWGREEFVPYRTLAAVKKRRVKDIGKAFHLVPASGGIMQKNILIPKYVDGADGYYEEIKDALERGSD
jgi:hypothetical protein